MVSVFGKICVNKANFTIFIADSVPENSRSLLDVTQQEAIQQCDSINATLGPVVNSNEYNNISGLIRNDETLFNFDPLVSNHDISFYIGLEAKVNNRNPTDFLFVDNVPGLEDGIDFYHVQRGQFPWGTDQPDKFFDNQDCGQILFFRNRDDNIPGGNVDGLVDDVACDKSHGFICRSLVSCVVEEPDLPDDPSNEADVDDDQRKNVIVATILLVFGGFTTLLLMIFIGSYMKLKMKVNQKERRLASSSLFVG